MNYINGNGLTLCEDGVQVIDNVIDNCDELIDLMWEWLYIKSLNFPVSINKNDISSYKYIKYLYPKHGMLLQYGDCGHNPMSWKIRSNKNVIKEFKKIWNTDDLITSFDGLSISLPCEYTNLGWYRNKDHLHCDQSFYNNEFTCVQGLINLYDVNDYDATLRVIRKSHLFHKQFNEVYNINNKSDWHVLTNEQINWYTSKLPNSDICIKAKRGSLVLWDSRTIHQGMQPQIQRLTPNFRCALYVCMLPRITSNNKNQLKRINAFKTRRTCNHYPNKLKLFPKLPRTYGNVYYNLQSINLNNYINIKSIYNLI